MSRGGIPLATLIHLEDFSVWKLLGSLDLGKNRVVAEECEECYSENEITSLTSLVCSA